jgi:ribosomal protein L9
MEVILREDVKSLGRAGELVKVKAGYARNFLLPQGLAYEASEGNRKRIAAESKARESRRVAERGEPRPSPAGWPGPTVLTRKAGEEGRLFGSITAQDIAEALATQGHTVDRRKIEMTQPIKTVGAHIVPVRLHADVHAEVHVSVEAE